MCEWIVISELYKLDNDTGFTTIDYDYMSDNNIDGNMDTKDTKDIKNTNNIDLDNIINENEIMKREIKILSQMNMSLKNKITTYDDVIKMKLETNNIDKFNKLNKLNDLNTKKKVMIINQTKNNKNKNNDLSSKNINYTDLNKKITSIKQQNKLQRTNK